MDETFLLKVVGKWEYFLSNILTALDEESQSDVIAVVN
jgi:hypothetical protein